MSGAIIHHLLCSGVEPEENSQKDSPDPAPEETGWIFLSLTFIEVLEGLVYLCPALRATFGRRMFETIVVRQREARTELSIANATSIPFRT